MCHVLVIEDEALVAMMIEDSLLAEGATSVAIAASEHDAVECAEQHRPDFITSDVRLVEGTGPKAVATILARHGEIPVLFITATPAECAACLEAAPVMQKPIRLHELKRQFHALVA